MSYAPPVDPTNSFLTSGFGMRTSRRTGRATFHAGVDFRGSTGDPIYAVAEGLVDVVQADVPRRTPTYGYGGVISLFHPALNQWTVYAHLSEVLVTPNQLVRPGQLIARCGRTSNAKFPRMGPHLHFEVRNRKADGSSPFPGPYRRYNVDPQPWLASKGIRTVRQGFELAAGTVNPSGLAGLGATDWDRCPDLQRFKREQGIAGLGAINDATLDMDYPGLPAEPLRDPWTYEPVGPGLLAGLASAGALSVAGGLWLLSR